MSGMQKKDDEAIVKRSSRKHDHEEHSSAWKVAFADFCLALMCLFLVLWVMAARKQEETEVAMRSTGGGSSIRDGNSQMDILSGGPRGSLIPREPVPSRGETLSRRMAAALNGDVGSPEAGHDPKLSKARYESAADLKELSDVLEKLAAEAGLEGNLRNVITPYGLRILLHDTRKEGMFERGSAVPSERFRLLLRRIGPVFAQIENQLLIVGHTDSLQYVNQGNGTASNWKLSSDRAMAARSHLLSGGMSPESILQVVGMADRAPIDASDPKADANRRIELMVLTTAQAQAMSSMFGVPREVQALTTDLDAAVPDGSVFAALRAKLFPEKTGRADAR